MPAISVISGIDDEVKFVDGIRENSISPFDAAACPLLFYPLSLERARSVVSMYILKERGYHIEWTSEEINVLSEHLAQLLVIRRL